MRSAFVLAAVVALSATVAGAEPAEFTIDPAASRLTVSGTVLGRPFVAQNPGSLTTGYTGSFFIDPQENAFLLTSNIPDALDQPVPQRPGSSTDAAEPANYGLLATGTGGDPLYAAIRGMDLWISTDFRPPVSLDGGSFDPTEVGMFVNGGSLLTSDATFHSIDLHGTGAPNTATTPGTLITVGNVQTFTLPVRITGSREGSTGGDFTLTFDGQLVATRIVPEPAAAAGLFVAAMALLGADPSENHIEGYVAMTNDERENDESMTKSE